MGAKVAKTLLGWDTDRVTHVVAECIRLGYYPTGWKSARGIAILKPGKPDYGRVRAYRVGKLVERTAAHLHEGQCRSRVRCSTADTVAVLMSLLKRLGRGSRWRGLCSLIVIFATLGVDPDLVRWTDSFTEDRRIRLEMEGRTGAEHSIESGIRQGSPVSPVLFAVYIRRRVGIRGCSSLRRRAGFTRFTFLRLIFLICTFCLAGSDAASDWLVARFPSLYPQDSRVWKRKKQKYIGLSTTVYRGRIYRLLESTWESRWFAQLHEEVAGESANPVPIFTDSGALQNIRTCSI